MNKKRLLTNLISFGLLGITCISSSIVLTSCKSVDELQQEKLPLFNQETADKIVKILSNSLSGNKPTEKLLSNPDVILNIKKQITIETQIPTSDILKIVFIKTSKPDFYNVEMLFARKSIRYEENTDFKLQEHYRNISIVTTNPINLSNWSPQKGFIVQGSILNNIIANYVAKNVTLEELNENSSNLIDEINVTDAVSLKNCIQNVVFSSYHGDAKRVNVSIEFDRNMLLLGDNKFELSDKKLNTIYSESFYTLNPHNVAVDFSVLSLQNANNVTAGYVSCFKDGTGLNNEEGLNKFKSIVLSKLCISEQFVEDFKFTPFAQKCSLTIIFNKSINSTTLPPNLSDDIKFKIKDKSITFNNFEYEKFAVITNEMQLEKLVSKYVSENKTTSSIVANRDKLKNEILSSVPPCIKLNSVTLTGIDVTPIVGENGYKLSIIFDQKVILFTNKYFTNTGDTTITYNPKIILNK